MTEERDDIPQKIRIKSFYRKIVPFMMLLVVISGTVYAIVSLSSESTQYSLNFSVKSTGPQSLNQVLAPATVYCTGVATGPLTTTGNNVMITGQYIARDTNVSSGGTVFIHIRWSTDVPTGTFHSGQCASVNTNLLSTNSLFFPDNTNAYSASWSLTRPPNILTANTWYFCVEIQTAATFSGHMNFNSFGTSSFIQSLELR